MHSVGSVLCGCNGVSLLLRNVCMEASQLTAYLDCPGVAHLILEQCCQNCPSAFCHSHRTARHTSPTLQQRCKSPPPLSFSWLPSPPVLPWEMAMVSLAFIRPFRWTLAAARLLFHAASRTPPQPILATGTRQAGHLHNRFLPREHNRSPCSSSGAAA